MLNRFLLLILFSVSHVWADEKPTTARQWLVQMQQAMKSLNYQGTLAFLKNNKLDTMKYSHAVNNDVEQEHLLSLNSPLREVLRQAGNVSCIFKESKSVEINHRPSGRSFIVDLPESFNQPSAAYDFILSEQQEVAMIPAQIIRIKPKDDFRYARKIWIGQQHFLPLKIEVYDSTGGVIEQVMFTELSVEHKLPFAKMDMNSDTLKVKHIHQSSLQEMNKADFLLNNLPKGFKEVFFVQMQMHGAKTSVEHLLLSDGFSSVSIYQEARDETIPVGIQSVGTVHSLVKIIDKVQFVIMGDVPIKTIQFIADGIKLKTQ